MRRIEILDALYLIKEICQEHSDCDSCPFSYERQRPVQYVKSDSGGLIYTRCGISNVDISPKDWKLKELPKTDIWRAFKE